MKFLAFILCFIPAISFAEVLPSLKAIEAPNWGGGRTIADDKFPEFLEGQQDYVSAILEWRRVIYTTQNKNIQQRAYLSIANLYTKLKEYKSALKTYENYLLLFPQPTKQGFILEQKHRLSVLTGDTSKTLIARSQLHNLSQQEQFKAVSQNLEKAELYALWFKGLSGENSFFETYSLKGNVLKENLIDFPVSAHESIQTATLLSFFPGMGYLYLGYVNWAILILMINISFFYALMNAMNHKHWGYGFAFGSFAAFVYISGIFYTGELAMEKAYIARLEAMKTWEGLYPPYMEDFEFVESHIQPHPLSPNAKKLQLLLKN